MHYKISNFDDVCTWVLLRMPQDKSWALNSYFGQQVKSLSFQRTQQLEIWTDRSCASCFLKRSIMVPEQNSLQDKVALNAETTSKHPILQLTSLLSANCVFHIIYDLLPETMICSGKSPASTSLDFEK